MSESKIGTKLSLKHKAAISKTLSDKRMRRSRYSEEQISLMKNYKEKGLTYKEIGNMFGCTASTVHWLVNNRRENEA